jgi:hypothetical protein
MISLGRHAERLARTLGAVLPLEPRGKAPLARLARHGVANATTDPHVVVEWWLRAPNANIGLVCGRLLVIDVDPRNNGDAELALLLATHGNFPRTPRARTGSGGEHIFFRRPSVELSAKLAPGIDLVHGPRRYVVASPSMHACGRRYEWLVRPHCVLAEPPGWLLDSATPRYPTPVALSAGVETSNDRVRRARAYVATIPPAVSGQDGHRQTFRAAVLVVRGFALTQEEALLALAAWNRSCVPPWSAADLQRKIYEAFNRGALPWGALLRSVGQ